MSVTAYPSLVLRSGALGDASRRTFQVTPTAAQAGSSFEASARVEPPQDEVLGSGPIHELLLRPPEYLETAKVFDLLLAVPKYGRVKVNKILSQCKISPSKTVGGLSQRQRGELVAMMRRR